jgi:hypothetical protein
MRLYIETESEYTHKIDCELSDTIAVLKKKIQEDCGPQFEEQTLIFKDNKLEDDYTLSDYMIQNEDTLQLVVSFDRRPRSIILFCICS